MMRAGAWSLGLTAEAMCVLALVSGAAGATGAAVTVSVVPLRSLADQPVAIRVAHLTPGSVATLSVRSTDSAGFTWVSSASFHATATGAIDPARMAPFAGSYSGVWSMGLLTAMSAVGSRSYFWAITTKPRPFVVSVEQHGKTLASRAFERQFTPRPITWRTLSVPGAGFSATFFSPEGVRHRTGIVTFGGSEGGMGTSMLAALLAANGYPALALAYFKEPGLPQTLQRIPLEYFAKALRWFSRRPQVDPSHIAVLGFSRGSEAALLLGAHYPSLVHAVIASVPENASVCGLNGSGQCDGPAWTFDGRPIPFTAETDVARPMDDPAAVIPVERIRGPVFLDCGESDEVWTSCAHAEAIVSRLKAHHNPYPRVLYQYPDAAHDVGDFVPYDPGFGTPEVWYDATEQAREELWPHLLHFLAGLATTH